MLVAKRLIGIFDVAQEHRALTEDEISLKQSLKQKLLGLAAVEKLRLRQQSQLTWIRANDANSSLFFLSVNIKTLHTHEGWLHKHQGQANEIYNHFSSVLVNQVQERKP